MASKTEAAKVKAIADTLRRQIFIGVEATAAQENAAKASSGGQQPRRERLLNVLSVMERDSTKSSSTAKPRIFCITVKRNRKLRLHKVKMNGNIAVISKTWGVDDVKVIEFKEPTRFSLHLSHKYDLTSADATLVEGFVLMLVNFCNKYSAKPPKYINTVSGGAGGPVPAGGMSNNRPKTAYAKNVQQQQQQQQQMPGTSPHTPQLDARALAKQQGVGANGEIASRSGSRQPQQQQQQQQPQARQHHSRMPSEQTAVMRRMTKYVADHGGDVSALVPMGAQPSDGMPENVMDTIGFDDDGDDAEELLLDEAFMLSADELVGDFGWRANIDAAQLESRLLGELHKLESENVLDMLEADKQVPKIVKELDQAIAHLEEMDEMLRFYSLELESMDDDVRKIQLENENLKIEEENQQRLLVELEKILKTITLSEEELQTLRNESLETTSGIERVERVAASLKRMLGTTPSGNLGGLEATHEKLKKYEFYSSNFSTRVYDYLKVMFQFKVDGVMNDKSRLGVRGIRLLSGPDPVHKEVIKYVGLTLWLKEAKPSADKDLQGLYLQCMNQLYTRQTKELVDSCRPYFFRYRHDVSAGGTNPIAEFSFSTNVGAVSGAPSTASNRRLSLDGISGAAHMALAGVSKSGNDASTAGTMGVTPSSEMQPAEAFAKAVKNVVANVIAEQNFVSDLFHYVPAAHIRAARRGQANAAAALAGGNGGIDDMQVKVGEHITFYNWVTQNVRPVGHWDAPRTKLDSKGVVSSTVHFGTVKEVKSMLDLLFGNLVSQVDSMVDMGTRFDPSQAIGMLEAVCEALSLCRGSDQGFLLNILEKCHDKLEMIFQNFVSEQARAIEATKFVTKKRVGALPYARIFPKFVAHIEELVGNSSSEARTIVDRAYGRISRLIFDSLDSQLREAERNVTKHSDDKDALKEQLNTYVMLLENLFVLLNGLQLFRTGTAKPYFKPTLDQYIEQAQTLQRKVTAAYNRDMLKRPMGKMLDFFDAVERALASNGNPLNLPNLNKSQLKKVIQSHNSSAMRESLKQLYKRVEKHFVNEPRLKPIVWKAMTEDVISNYQRIVTLLARAYQSTNITLEYTQADLKRWCDEH